MLERKFNLFTHFDGPAPDESLQLEREGHCLLRSVFEDSELHALRDEVKALYDEPCRDVRDTRASPSETESFRYQVFNRGALCQEAMGNPRILEVLDPLLGNDCHVINNTAWRNASGEVDNSNGRYLWHIDAGPHVPRPAGVDWPDDIPYPIFVVATHIYLEDCGLDDGPTMVLPTSHRSGRRPPEDQYFNQELTYDGHAPSCHIAKAGDVGFFVSDAWHRRRLPTAESTGRFFLQTNYGRRDIAQRLLATAESNHVGEEARLRAATPRQRSLIGLHPAAFYDG